MIEIIKDYNQGSEEWFQAKTGVVGASTVSKIITSTGKRSTQRKAFLYQIAGERISGRRTETYSNGYMQAGIEKEEDSRRLFEFIQGVEVEEAALILPHRDAYWGCSPDGIIKDKEEGLELKNVIPGTQAKYLHKGVLPTEYKLQCQFSLAVTGWEVWWFMSNCDGMKPLIVKVKRDEEFIKLIKAEVNIFLREVDELIKEIS